MDNIIKENINQLKYMIETFECKDKRFQDGFIGGLFYAMTMLEYGKQYADKKIDWNKIGRCDYDPDLDVKDKL